MKAATKGKTERENAMLREALVNSKEHAAVVRRALTWYRTWGNGEPEEGSGWQQSDIALYKACAALLKARAHKGERNG